MVSNLGYPHRAGELEANVYIELFMPNHPRRTQTFTFAPNQTLEAGMILGRIDASGQLVQCLAAAGDGSEVPFAILQEDLVIGATEKTMAVVIECNVNEDALIYGAGHDADSVRADLRKIGISLYKPTYSG